MGTTESGGIDFFSPAQLHYAYVMGFHILSNHRSAN
jgi:hypothetical protein